MARFDLCISQPLVRTFNGISVDFDAVALVNVSKKFNLFKQVGTGAERTNWTYFASETANPGANFVIDPVQEKSTLTNLTNHFYYAVGIIDPESLPFTPYNSFNSSSATGGAVNGNLEGLDPGTYYIWEYCSPNSVLGADKQKNGNSTGIVFRGEIKAGSSQIQGMDQGDDLYAYNGILYGNEAKLKSIGDNPGTDLQTQLAAAAYNKASGTSGSKGSANLKNAGFAVYKPTSGKYYCYFKFLLRNPQLD